MSSNYFLIPNGNYAVLLFVPRVAEDTPLEGSPKYIIIFDVQLTAINFTHHESDEVYMLLYFIIPFSPNDYSASNTTEFGPCRSWEIVEVYVSNTYSKICLAENILVLVQIAKNTSGLEKVGFEEFQNKS